MKRRATRDGNAELETKRRGLGTFPTEVAETDELARFDRLLVGLRTRLRALSSFLSTGGLRKCRGHYRPLVDSRPSSEDAAVGPDTLGRLLAGLDEEQRAVLEMVYGSRLTLAEVSAARGRNLDTVKDRFYRAHAALLAAGEREDPR